MSEEDKKPYVDSAAILKEDVRFCRPPTLGLRPGFILNLRSPASRNPLLPRSPSTAARSRHPSGYGDPFAPPQYVKAMDDYKAGLV